MNKKLRRGEMQQLIGHPGHWPKAQS